MAESPLAAVTAQPDGDAAALVQGELPEGVQALRRFFLSVAFRGDPWKQISGLIDLGP
jgi:hypothetical protein